MIDRMLGAGVAGIYTLASAISMLTTLFNDVLLQTLEPWMYQKIKAGRVADISRVALPALGVIAAINIGFIAFAPELVAIFAPASYLQAIWVMPPITMSVFFAFLYNFFVVFELYYEKTLFVTIATIAGAGLNLGLNFWLIPRLGFYAAGYTTLICYVAYALGHYLLMRRICRDRLAGVQVYQPRRLLLIVGIFMSVGLLFLVSYRWPLIRYGLIGVGSLVLFLSRHRLVATVRDLVAVRQGDETSA
ncbi:lipopolysaccharide biosynthesis protein [Levilactobacillus yonginensis]|uniref:lipopolysaccharide biosynthesis protein n=1 Tax=Levilactobacillus yonginensis TaxID=1054041 RepID=UPI00345D6AFB